MLALVVIIVAVGVFCVWMDREATRLKSRPHPYDVRYPHDTHPEDFDETAKDYTYEDSPFRTKPYGT